MDQYAYPCIFLEEKEMYINQWDKHVQEEMDMLHSTYPKIVEQSRMAKNDVFLAIPYVKEELWSQISKQFQNVYETRWNDYAIDVVHKDVNKCVGIEKTLQRYNLTKENAYAIGDGPNDADMISAVHTFIAMGNSVQELKDKSEFITSDIDEDGLKYAFKKWIMQ